MRCFILLFTCLLIFTNCQQESVESESEQRVITKLKKITSNYLEFDEVVYYHHPTLDWDSDMNADEVKTEEEDILRIVAFNMYPEIEEMEYIKDFERIGYEKMVLNEYQFKAIKAITTNYKYDWQSQEKSKNRTMQSNFIGKNLLTEIVLLKQFETLVSIINNQLQLSSNSQKEAVCLKIFRDILVFKKDGKNVGMSKICYECIGDRTVTVGNKRLNIDEMYIAKVLDIDVRR